MKYSLEVYPPDDPKTAYAVFHSATPFGAIHTGDDFNPAILTTETWRVVHVEHIVSGTGERLSHKIMLWTETAVPFG